jgi:hypothetical protein
LFFSGPAHSVVSAPTNVCDLEWAGPLKNKKKVVVVRGAINRQPRRPVSSHDNHLTSSHVPSIPYPSQHLRRYPLDHGSCSE